MCHDHPLLDIKYPAKWTTMRKEMQHIKQNHSKTHICCPLSTEDQMDLSSKQDTFTTKTVIMPMVLTISLCQGIPPPVILPFLIQISTTLKKDAHARSFECGQIWALYSEVDKFPKLYGWIRKVSYNHSQLMRWLKQEKRWLEQDIPISCGKFKIRNWKTKYHGNDVFSHLVNTGHIDSNWQIEILP